MSEEKNRVLMISYNYHPIGGVGSIRSIEFSGYLIDYGWKPIVISCKDVQANEVRNRRPIPPHVKLYHSRNILKVGQMGKKMVYDFGLDKQIVVPDHYIGWIAPTVIKAKEIAKKENIDIIYVSCPPYSSAVIGYLLKLRINKPLVIDLRDAWTLNPYAFYYNKIIGWLDEKIERTVFKKCDFLITTSGGAKKGYNKKYPFTKNKSKTIFNGYNEELFPPKKLKKFHKFTIAYIGKFYGARTPNQFLKALSNLVERGKINRNNIEIIFAGVKMQFVEDMVLKNGLEDIIKFKGYVPFKEAIEFMYRSHLLLLVQGTKKVKGRRYVAIAGKTFEYLASGTPILSLTPEGDNTEIIRDYSTNSYVITDNDLEKVSEAILDCYIAWKKGDIPKNKKAEIVKREFTRRNQTKELADVFDRVAGER